MFRQRVIPVLLLKNKGLVKSINFERHRYVGDPINAVKIFNDKKADELIFLDITASVEGRCISPEFVYRVGDEANMPFAVGGGIRTIKEIRKILSLGAEKVILNTFAFENPDFVKEAVNAFGSSTIVVCIDVKKSILGKGHIYIYSGKQNIKKDPIDAAKEFEEFGVGELIIQSIDKDGTYEGYDLELINKVSKHVTIPVVALGGAGDILDLKEGIVNGKCSAVAAGSLFVYHGPRKAVLINYPNREELDQLFSVN
jgi:imidazole glycerol-phosphate synthase subunit HisF